MTEIYLHIVARMADYMATHLLDGETVSVLVLQVSQLLPMLRYN